MTALIDSHTFLWMVSDDPRLSRSARDVVQDGANRLLLSLASCWEIGIKFSLGKLELQIGLEQLFTQELDVLGVTLLPIDTKHILHLPELYRVHGDPFDRLLVAQCLAESLPLVSADRRLDGYPIHRIW